MTLPLTDRPQLGSLTADEDDLEDFKEILKQCPRPSVLKDSGCLKSALDQEKVIRYTVMGETIGFSVGQDYLVSPEYSQWEAEIRKRLQTVMQNLHGII